MGPVKKQQERSITVLDEIQMARSTLEAQLANQDGTKSEMDWFRMIFSQLNKLMNHYEEPSDFRKRMIEIAAIAQTAAENFDRKQLEQDS